MGKFSPISRLSFQNMVLMFFLKYFFQKVFSEFQIPINIF